MRFTQPFIPYSNAVDLGLRGVIIAAHELREQLLAWWNVSGRHSIPWKQQTVDSWTSEAEPLDPYPIWIAEVMLNFATQEA